MARPYVRPSPASTVVFEPPMTLGALKSMRANRATDTKPEVTLRLALFHRGLRYKKNRRDLPGKPDLAFGREKVCVFVHGCFWHSCPTCSTTRNLKPKHNAEAWEAKIARNVARDAVVLEALGALGWGVVVIWECQVKRDLGWAVERVLEALDQAPV